MIAKLEQQGGRSGKGEKMKVKNWRRQDPSPRVRRPSEPSLFQLSQKTQKGSCQTVYRRGPVSQEEMSAWTWISGRAVVFELLSAMALPGTLYTSVRSIGDFSWSIQENSIELFDRSVGVGKIDLIL